MPRNQSGMTEITRIDTVNLLNGKGQVMVEMKGQPGGMSRYLCT